MVRLARSRPGAARLLAPNGLARGAVTAVAAIPGRVTAAGLGLWTCAPSSGHRVCPAVIVPPGVRSLRSRRSLTGRARHAICKMTYLRMRELTTGPFLGRRRAGRATGAAVPGAPSAVPWPPAGGLGQQLPLALAGQLGGNVWVDGHGVLLPVRRPGFVACVRRGRLTAQAAGRSGGSRPGHSPVPSGGGLPFSLSAGLTLWTSGKVPIFRLCQSARVLLGEGDALTQLARCSH